MAGKGAGSTAGQLGGAAVGGYLGSQYGNPQLGAQLGAAGGAALGGAVDPQSAQPRMTTFNPYQNFGAMGQIENAVLGGLGGGGGGGNPYVGPRPEQSQALADLQGYQRQASPLFGQSVGQQQGTVGGKYLDPMQSAPFQRLSDARLGLARQLFGEFAPQYSSSATARGVPYSSSAREAGVQRGGERISTQAAQDIAQAGWGQYGQERQLQEQAARGGMQLAPGLAGQVFGAGEQLRGAEQQGNTVGIESALRAQGYGNEAIGNALRYMGLRGLQGFQGSTPNEQMAGYLKSAAPLIAGIGQYYNQPGAQPPEGLGAQIAALK